MCCQDDQPTIRSPHHPREGWEDQFRAVREQGDDQHIEGFPASTWDEEEWEWQ
jgi:hypothetical protein